MVNNAFAYGPDGKVFFAAINFPGSWADSSLTAQFLHQMKRRFGGSKTIIITHGITPNYLLVVLLGLVQTQSLSTCHTAGTARLLVFSATE